MRNSRRRQEDIDIVASRLGWLKREDGSLYYPMRDVSFPFDPEDEVHEIARLIGAKINYETSMITSRRFLSSAGIMDSVCCSFETNTVPSFTTQSIVDALVSCAAEFIRTSAPETKTDL